MSPSSPITTSRCMSASASGICAKAALEDCRSAGPGCQPVTSGSAGLRDVPSRVDWQATWISTFRMGSSRPGKRLPVTPSCAFLDVALLGFWRQGDRGAQPRCWRVSEWGVCGGGGGGLRVVRQAFPCSRTCTRLRCVLPRTPMLPSGPARVDRGEPEACGRWEDP